MGKILKVISITLNIFFLLLLLSFFFVKKPASMTFFDMTAATGVEYTTGASIVSVPAGGADLVFSAPDFSLAAGNEALLQFSVYTNKQQMNMAFSPLYDHSVVAIENSSFGMRIRARKPGETVLQTLTENGIKDIARIRVTE